MLAGRYGRPVPSTSPKVGFPLLVSGFFYRRITKIELFTERIIGIANGNFICGLKLPIVVSVSSTLPKDGFKPAAFIPVGFFLPISGAPKKKPAIDTDAGFPVFSRPQLSGLDFVGG
jgi:hypothetical protein